MKYIVTGSHGFIGRNLCKRLESDGHSVFEYDIKIGKSLFDISGAICLEADGIFHLACVNQEDAEENQTANLTVNGYAASFLADRAKSADIPLFYTSSCSIYGQARKIPTSKYVKCNPKTKYSVAKLAGEHFIRSSGCNYKIFRLSNVYGPYQTIDNPYCGVIGKFIDSKYKNETLKVITPGTQTRDYTYVDDVLDALLTDELPMNGTFNISRGEEISVLQVAGLISDKIELVAPRSIDCVKRRCLISDYYCPTGLAMGILKTIDWLREPDLDFLYGVSPL